MYEIELNSNRFWFKSRLFHEILSKIRDKILSHSSNSPAELIVECRNAITLSRDSYDLSWLMRATFNITRELGSYLLTSGSPGEELCEYLLKLLNDPKRISSIKHYVDLFLFYWVQVQRDGLCKMAGEQQNRYLDL